MTDQASTDLLQKATQWWSTEIIDMKPGVIRFRGFPIEQLIGRVSFPQMIWLMLKGDLPSPEQGALLEAALVAAVDHGPQAPSIAIGRSSTSAGSVYGIDHASSSGICPHSTAIARNPCSHSRP